MYCSATKWDCMPLNSLSVQRLIQAWNCLAELWITDPLCGDRWIICIRVSNAGNLFHVMKSARFSIARGIFPPFHKAHYNDVIMSVMASVVTSIMSVYSNVHSGADQRKHQTSASLAFVRGIHRWPVNSPHKGPVTRKMFPFDDVIMTGYQNVAPGHQATCPIVSLRMNRV